jgi:hypothetical protein
MTAEGVGLPAARGVNGVVVNDSCKCGGGGGGMTAEGWW